ncbi:MAG: hypothetical protein R3C56_26740 [Pirellulaceae bacterium]
MSKRPNGTMGGVILIGLGLLFVALSFREQPDRINLAPHRFYSEADRDEFQSAKEHVFNLKKGIGVAPESEAENNLAGVGQSEPAIDEHGQPTSSETADPLASAEAHLAALKQKQVDAFSNQDTLSLTLKSIGIAFLAVGAILLLRVSRANRVAKTVDKLAPVESPGH